MMVKTPKGKKRSRLETQTSASATRTRTVDNTNKHASAISKRARKPFRGKIFAISTLSRPNDSSSLVSQQQQQQRGDQSYKGLLSLCEELGGAKVGSQVHKKVFCVVATINAIEGETQRVRKAWKRGIPVVRVDWVRKCLREGNLLPFGHDLVAGPSSPNKNVTSNAERGERTLETTDEDGANVPIEVAWKKTSLDLGCCCVCHETGKIDCEWCLDCGGTTKQSEDVAESVTTKPETKKDSKGSKQGDITRDRQVDLGCCCVCHETGRVDCEWCVDCNVSKS